MGHAVKRRGRSKERPPDRALLDLTPAGAFALPVAVAKHARHFAAGDHLRACRQEIFEERAAAVAIASDIDELGHLDSRAEHAVAASMKGGAAAAYVIFRAETRVARDRLRHLPATLAPHAGIVSPLGLQARNRGRERGSDVVSCRSSPIGLPWRRSHSHPVLHCAAVHGGVAAARAVLSSHRRRCADWRRASPRPSLA